MKQHKALFATFLTSVMLAGPLAATESCEERLEIAKTLTAHPTWIAMQIEFHQKNGDGTQQELDALKQKWLDGKERGYAQLKQIIEECEKQAKETDDPAEAARLLAVVFNAKLAEHGSANHRDIYFDAVATLSSVDHHDETDAVIPFLISAGMGVWREDPEEAKHLMQRAIDLAERHYGKDSTKRADILTKLASLYSPVELSPGYKRPHADEKRSEALYSEALEIYEHHPEAMASEEYSGLVGQAEQLYRLIGNEERANELDEQYSELFKAAAAARLEQKKAEAVERERENH